MVDSDYWWDAIVEPGRDSELLRGVSPGHIIELRTDYGVGYESDDTLVQLCYGWELEGLFTDASLDWLIYASTHRCSRRRQPDRLARSSRVRLAKP